MEKHEINQAVMKIADDIADMLENNQKFNIDGRTLFIKELRGQNYSKNFLMIDNRDLEYRYFSSMPMQLKDENICSLIRPATDDEDLWFYKNQKKIMHLAECVKTGKPDHIPLQSYEGKGYMRALDNALKSLLMGSYDKIKTVFESDFNYSDCNTFHELFYAMILDFLNSLKENMGEDDFTTEDKLMIQEFIRANCDFSDQEVDALTHFFDIPKNEKYEINN